MTTSARNEEESTFFEEDSEQPIPPGNVVAYNELRSCADLHRMHASGKLEIQPDFQRDIVWKSEERARFIDSLVKQLPIPSMCFSLDYQTQRWKVIDGLQRMHTITSFLGSGDWKIESLQDIHPLLRGRRNSELRNGNDESKRLYASVEDLTIPVTVIRCAYDDASHMRYLFTIFNRLNSGGVRLNNQEIRNCIYSGPFNDLLKRIDRDDSNWSVVCKRTWGRLDRFRSVELLLRALAFSTELDRYDGNLAGFLNSFMLRARKSSTEVQNTVDANLRKMSGLARHVLDGLSIGKKTITFVEGVLVGVLTNIDNAPEPSAESAVTWATERALKFADLPAYGAGARYGLANALLVKDRLNQAVTVFS